VVSHQGAKDLFAPSWETTALAAIPGAALGVAFGKNKQKNTPKPKKDIGAIVAAATKETDVPYTKSANEIATDDATVARLEAAIAKQNPQQGEIRVGKDQEAYFTSPETEFARQQAEQRMLQENEGAYADPFNRMSRELAPDAEPRPPVNAVDPFEQIRQQALASGDQQRYQQAQAAIEARQKQLEFETARQTLLDQQAADRARQGQAPTGADADAARLRETQNKRLPGDNTPLEMDSPYPVDIKQFPQVMQDAPYQYKGGLDFNAAEFQSLPVEKQIQVKEAWKRRNIERQAEQDAVAKQEQRLQEMEDTLLPMEEALREGAYKPTGDGQGPKTRAAKAEAAPGVRQMRKGPGGAGQGGSTVIFGDLAEGIVRLGGGLKGMFTGVRSETPDTLTTPRSAENIAAKTALRNKARAIGKSDSVYDNVSTIEEALANLPTKDIGSNQTLASGNEGVIRRNTTNGPLKFVRYLRTKAQTNTDALTAKYITGKDGFNETFRKLSDAEKMEVHEVIQELSKQRVDYSDALADKLELTPAQRSFMEARGRALKAVLEVANTTNKSLGFDLIKALPGYSPGMFASTYVSLVGHYKGEGTAKRWVTEAVVNANSKWEYQQGLKYYKDKGMETITLDRRGLNSSTKGGRNFDGTMKLLAALAEYDSRFADAKGILDSFLKDQTKKLYNFDVHEMRKKGVEGNIGNKPWLDAKTNAKEALEAEVNYIDEAFKYWNYQEMLNKTKQLVDDPKLEAYPNTRKYLDKYVKQVTGNNLHPLGAGINSLVDAVFENIGKAGAKLGLDIPENPNRVFAGAREFGSALMMNIYAPAFASIQLIQMFQSGIPEAMKIRNEMGLSADAPVTSLAKSMSMRTWFAAMNQLGKFDEVPNSPMKEAYTWMREHGIDHYNEIQMSHEAAQNPKWTKTKNALFWPTRLPEMITRPTVFMWYADMFHQAGLRGEELHYTAKNATDYAMVNYHTDERPMVYQQLGVVGQSVGALRTFVHNAAEQQISRTKEARQNPGAFLAMMGFTAGLMGVAGLPFYDEIDQWFIQPVTKRSARDWMSEALHPALINGVASHYSEIDLQSRFSMADMIPGNPAEALAGPQLSRMFQILDSGFGYIKNQDTQSFNELAKAIIPSGAYGAYEEANLVDEQGYVLDKEGQVKYTEPRSEKERNVRKVLGLRPLRERLEDEDLYTTKKLEQRMTDKQKTAYSRMRAGLNLGDDAGFEDAKQDYLDNEGDPKAIGLLIKRNAKQSQLSARQRVITAPGKSVGSVNKYNRYWED